MKTHTLKILGKYWGLIQNGQKTCEIRKDDRAYKVGDQIEFVVIADDGSGPLSYKNSPPYEITHVLHFPEGLRDGYVCLSLKKIK